MAKPILVSNRMPLIEGIAAPLCQSRKIVEVRCGLGAAPLSEADLVQRIGSLATRHGCTANEPSSRRTSTALRAVDTPPREVQGQGLGEGCVVDGRNRPILGPQPGPEAFRRAEASPAPHLAPLAIVPARKLSLRFSGIPRGPYGPANQLRPATVAKTMRPATGSNRSSQLSRDATATGGLHDLATFVSARPRQPCHSLLCRPRLGPCPGRGRAPSSCPQMWSTRFMCKAAIGMPDQRLGSRALFT
jgi:hypothetical protein